MTEEDIIEDICNTSKSTEFTYTLTHRINNEMLIPQYGIFDWRFIKTEFPKLLSLELLTDKEFLHTQFQEMRKHWNWLESHQSENLKRVEGYDADLLIKLDNEKETIDYMMFAHNMVGCSLFEITISEEVEEYFRKGNYEIV